MRDLEIGLRAVLLQRRGKRTTLTSAGLLFQEHARTIPRQIEKSLQEIGNEPGELCGTLRLGVIPYLNVALMPQLLGRFAEENPGVDLSILEISSTDIETGLEDGRLDVGLGWVTRHSPNLRYEHLCNDKFNGGGRGRAPVGEAPGRRTLRIAPITLAAIAGHLCHAANDGRDLPKSSSPPPHRRGDQFD